jgi:prophage regulatory protein
MNDHDDDPILDKKSLVADLKLSGSTIDRLERAGKFPRRLMLSPRRVGWVSSQIRAWKASRQEAR